jgi:hypothetical protein
MEERMKTATERVRPLKSVENRKPSISLDPLDKRLEGFQGTSAPTNEGGGNAVRGWNIDSKEKRAALRRQKPFLLQIMAPGINLLPCHIMALRNLRHCRIIDPDRHDDPELLFITPPTPPLKPKNFTPHKTPPHKTRRKRRRYHVS